MFDAGCIARLERVLAPHEVGIVVTSTWRLEWPLPRIRAQLGTLGEYVMGVTPEIEDPFVRFGRYQEVLRHRGQNGLVETPWVAIDDEAGRYPGGRENLILTDSRTGFGENDAIKLSRLLNADYCQRAADLKMASADALDRQETRGVLTHTRPEGRG